MMEYTQEYRPAHVREILEMYGSLKNIVFNKFVIVNINSLEVFLFTYCPSPLGLL